MRKTGKRPVNFVEDGVVLGISALIARVFALAAVLLLAITLTWPPGQSASACTLVEPKTGDLNADGLTNSLDALSVLFYDAGLMAAPSEVWLAGADVNCDLSVSALDATLILQADAGLYQIRP